MSRHFYVPAAALDGERVVLGPDLARRLARVLRLRPGHELTLFDGAGHETRAVLEQLDDRSGAAIVVERFSSIPEPRVAVHLFQSIAKGDRFDWLVEKATEVGVARIVPLIAARSVVRTPAQASRVERWRRIAIEAAEQCGRGAIPTVDGPQDFEAALESSAGVRLMPYEDAGPQTPGIPAAIASLVPAPAHVSIFIGPEGGWHPDEVVRARAAGAVVVRMGPRVLRSETAGLVASTLVLASFGDLGEA